MLQVIGKVSATEKMPSTIDNFYFWTDKGQILSPFDIVKVEHVSSNSDKLNKKFKHTFVFIATDLQRMRNRLSKRI